MSSWFKCKHIILAIQDSNKYICIYIIYINHNIIYIHIYYINIYIYIYIYTHTYIYIYIYIYMYIYYFHIFIFIYIESNSKQILSLWYSQQCCKLLHFKTRLQANRSWTQRRHFEYRISVAIYSARLSNTT
jgi:hypothetical protein